MEHQALTGISSFRTLLTTPYLPDIGGRGGIKMASVSTPSANEPTKDVILLRTVQLKPMIKAQISERMVSRGINDVAFASVYTEKTCLRKLMKIIRLLLLL